MEDILEFIGGKVIGKDETIVLGISGGPDSMVLLHLFNSVKKANNWKLVCAHVNHNLRKESEEEKEFLEKYCDINDIVFEYYKIENYGEDNFHNEARSIRYNYFESIIKKYNSKYLITAHHGDDLIETILMRISRGSSLKGYSGFERIVKRNGYKIIRPLITHTKDEILNYAKEHKIEYRVDKSNFKDVYTRNRYRKYVLPFLKNEDANIHKKYLKFSETLLEYNDYIEKEIKKVISNVFENRKLNIDKFKELDEFIQRKIIFNILENLYNDDLILISDVHAESIYRLVKSNSSNGEVHLPNNIIAKKDYNIIEFKEHEKELVEKYEVEIINNIKLPNSKTIEKVIDCEWTNNYCTRLNSKEITLPLYVRTRENGDKIKVKGLKGTKKINDIFTDEKIHLSERELWPIVCDANNNVVWVPGLKKSKFDKKVSEEYDIILRYY